MKFTPPRSGPKESAAIDAALRIQGLVGRQDLLALYRAAAGLPLNAVVVEIGSFMGRSTVCLALALKDAGNLGARVYAIDSFDGNLGIRQKGPTYEPFLKNIRAAGVEALIVPLRKTSEQAGKEWDGRLIHLLWIDGDHYYPAPAADIRAWKPFLKEGGLLLMDDCYMPGVERSIAEEVAASSDFARLWMDDGLAYAVKGPCDGWRRLGKRVYFRVWTALAALRFALLPT